MIEKHLELLGLNAKDCVTGLTGVVTCISYDLYGCIQALITPSSIDGELKNSSWFDVTRLKIIKKKRVMKLPDFSEGYIANGKKGPADKPTKLNSL